ncbi:hypothetical protein SpCBS45565_g02184 [Spizellomyces sp. 'palustris']|nr:hypothetical protein SpCBS45565_g02184 [Spizellomyces sp. 'palustris']
MVFIRFWKYPSVDQLARKKFDLDSIIAGKTYDPIGLKDLNSYCRLVEHSSENLHFYLWFLDYSARFDSLPEGQSCLSAPATVKETDEKFNATFEATEHAVSIDPLHSEIRVEKDEYAKPPSLTGTDAWLLDPSADTKAATETLFLSRSPKAKLQPFRREVDRAISTFILTTSPRELNLPGPIRTALIQAATETTHPSVFEPAAQHIRTLLSTTTYPNFLKYACGNANYPRMVFAVTLTSTLMLAGLFTGIWTVMTELDVFVFTFLDVDAKYALTRCGQMVPAESNVLDIGIFISLKEKYGLKRTG